MFVKLKKRKNLLKLTLVQYLLFQLSFKYLHIKLGGASLNKDYRKILIASVVGSSIEWFDYFLYGTVAALVFNQLFFVTEDPAFGTLYAFATFALAFFIRPLGGVIFSHIGDRIGRKMTLVLTLSLMGGATFLMGVLPTYETVGIWAPIMLIVLRLIQGLGLGGEWGGALLLAVEYAPKGKRGLFGSIPQMGVTIGMLLGDRKSTRLNSSHVAISYACFCFK